MGKGGVCMKCFEEPVIQVINVKVEDILMVSLNPEDNGAGWG